MKLMGAIDNIETIARGHGIREYAVLVERYGGRNWVKRKGMALVELNGVVARAELHWYECHGVGKVKLKVKQWL